ncbi:hypothetical protein [Duganella vulcania]|uniref:Uncharacterized protein n=1 Tax=Duganella vulcania TaxID=2692166 RepID=A0A845GHH8_9BURK|nr:hypothetical protein [Duganella vulcania]MYM92756.1 hypothetical protein [Duganella vulcania]
MGSYSYNRGAAVALFGFVCQFAQAITQPAATTNGSSVIHPELGEVWRLDLDLSTIETARFVLHRAASELAGKGLSTIIIACALALLLMRYGTKLWQHFTKTDISTRGLKIAIALLLPLAFAGHIIGTARDLRANRIPDEEIAQWKYDTTDVAKMPKHIEHNVPIPD